MTLPGYSNEVNADMDDRVVKSLQTSPLPPHHTHSNDTLDKKYINFKASEELFNVHETLRNDLIEAWDSEHKSFAKIRGLQILRAESTVAATPPSDSGLSDGVKRGLLSALTRLYQGIAVDGFYEYLERSHRYYLDDSGSKRPQYYAKFCSIVQCSGTGKTRAILELAHKGVLMLYINLRPEADKSGFPLRDDVPASILTGGCKSPAEYFIQCCVFFSAIFKLIRGDLLDRLERDGKAAVESWNKDMCKLDSPYRAKFFERLKGTYQQINSHFELTTTTDDAVDAMQALLLEDTSTDKTSGCSDSDSSPEVKSRVHYYERLTEVLDSVFPNADIHQPKLVMTTAHTLAATLALLALDRGLQDELVAQVQGVTEGREDDTLLMEDQSKLNKILGAFYEGIRMFPAGVLLARESLQDTILDISDGNEPKMLSIKKGTLVVVDMVGVQYHQRYFSEPDEFRPSRWYKEHSYENNVAGEEYTAFSIGPRACLGRKFATTEGVCFLAMLLREWRIEPLLAMQPNGQSETIDEWRGRVIQADIQITLGINTVPLRFVRRR